jgi:hypothetical protein
MDAVNRLENIIENRLWVKNSITMGRIQCAKLIKIKGELVLIVSADIINKPLWARVERLLFSNGEIIVFYDGQYCEELKSEDYNEYKQYLNEDEWKVLFEEDTTVKLEEMKLISKDDGFYFDIHVNIDNYENEYDEEKTLKLNEHFDI